MTTPHKSFEERVEEVINKSTKALTRYTDKFGDEITDLDNVFVNVPELKAALLAAHKEEVERIIGEDTDLPMKQFEHAYHDGQVANAIRREQRTRANLTGKEQS